MCYPMFLRATNACVKVIAYAGAQKEHANGLYRTGRLDFAVKKYERALAVIKKCRSVETDGQATALAALQAALLANLASAHMAKQACDPRHTLTRTRVLRWLSLTASNMVLCMLHCELARLCPSHVHSCWSDVNCISSNCDALLRYWLLLSGC